MENPWKNVALDDYENHMSLTCVYQLLSLNKIMGEQFKAYDVTSVGILGIAGGNGLDNLIETKSINEIYGIDINEEYLNASAERYPLLANRYHTVAADINGSCDALPRVEMVIANLFIEYVGCENFVRAVEKMQPRYVSCVIQIDPAESFVSDSPYTTKLEVLDCVHSTVDSNELHMTMHAKGYEMIDSFSSELPNGKVFKRIDFKKTNPT